MTCSRCRRDKPPAEMVPHPAFPGGRMDKCLACAASALGRLALPARPPATPRKRKVRHPAKYRAWDAMQAALRDGSIRKGPCERCGDPRVHSHHDDLARPTEVRWFCAAHRDELRREMYSAARA